jgi:hypothetical protein
MNEPNQIFTYCANHPQTPTSLRCNKCGKPVCLKCIVRTPVGYRCKDCVRGQQQIFETAEWYDYVVAGIIAAPLAGVAGFLVTALSYFAIILAPVVGGAVAEIIRWAVRRRRGRYLPHLAAAAFAVGALALVLIQVGLALFSMGNLFSVLWTLIYAVLGAGTVFARLGGGISVR